MVRMCLIFFFKQKTAYEMRISDWSSDVCSSDLQIEEFIRDYHGEGIQHLALATDDIFTTVDRLRANGIRFQDTPDTYYDMIDQRVPGHGHNKIGRASCRERVCQYV